MTSLMEYGAPEDAAPEYDGAGDSAPESDPQESDPQGGPPESGGAQALPPYSENVPDEAGGDRREWRDDTAQIAADALGQVAQGAEHTAENDAQNIGL